MRMVASPISVALGCNFCNPMQPVSKIALSFTQRELTLAVGSLCVIQIYSVGHTTSCEQSKLLALGKILAQGDISSSLLFTHNP